MGLLLKKDMAIFLKCSCSEVMRLVKLGRLPDPIYLNSYPRWDKAMVMQWIRNRFDMDKYEKEFMKLPVDSEVKGKLEWITSHPAMGRMARREKRTYVVLQIADLDGAPSRSAVTQLQSYVNRPEAYFTQIMGLQMKDMWILQQLERKKKAPELEVSTSPSGEVEKMLKLLVGEAPT